MASLAEDLRPAMSETGALPVSLKLGWSSGAFGIAILMNGISGLILLFCASILKIDPWLAGAIIFVSKMFDVVTDPIVGMWSDRHESPRGRRRPFLLWGAWMSAASFAMIFSSPIFANQWLTASYVFVALCIYAFGYTLYNIPFMAMPAEMTEDTHERSSIHAYRIVFVALGSLIAGAGSKFALERLGKTDPQSYAVLGVGLAALILISTLIAYYATGRARFTVRAAQRPSSALVQMRGEFTAVRSNPDFLRLIGVKFFQLMGVQTTLAAFAYFMVQYLQRSFDTFALFGLVSTVATIAAAPVLVSLSRRTSKKAAYFVAAGANIAYSLSWMLASPGEPTWAIVARAALVGVAVAGNVTMAMSMLTDIINRDAASSGVYREGVFTAFYSFVEKLTGAVGPLIVGVMLSIAGFDNKQNFELHQSGNVDQVLLMAVSWLPTLFGLVAVWLLAGYDGRQPPVRIETGKEA
jgi:glycoside/pentoside/hexuronide:cation symporter, GPH family